MLNLPSLPAWENALSYPVPQPWPYLLASFFPCVNFSVVPMNSSLLDWAQCNWLHFLDWPNFFDIFCLLLMVSEHHWICDSVLDIRWKISEIMFLKRESISFKTQFLFLSEISTGIFFFRVWLKKNIYQIHFLNANFVSCWVMNACVCMWYSKYLPLLWSER